VTSPPYWNLKEYAAGNRNQVGHFEDYEHFLLLNNPVFTAYGCVPALVYPTLGSPKPTSRKLNSCGLYKGLYGNISFPYGTPAATKSPGFADVSC
jgi:hypothetical protein